MLNHEACTGCGVCASVCPVSCISMTETGEGFFYPSVDGDKCVSCGLCETKCHLNHGERWEEGKAYAVISHHREELQRSSSGGVFSVLARKILHDGGVVVGCALADGTYARHVIIRDSDELYRLQGSKYVESDLLPVLGELSAEAKSGRTILFSGTGCQIGAVRSWLGQSDNIIYVEILCHGVPSRSLFQKHNRWIEQIHHDRLTDTRFRCKEGASWNMSYRFAYTFDSGKTVVVLAYQDAYYMNFIKGTLMRRSCYRCAYAGKTRVGDITVGDYWGVEEHHPELDAQGGVSAVLINSPKGESLFHDCLTELTVIPTNIEYIQERVHALEAPLSMPAKREMIYTQINEIGYEAWQKRYRRSKLCLTEGLKYAFKTVVPNKLRVKAAKFYHKIR